MISFFSVFTEAGLKVEGADLTSLSVYRYYYLQEENRGDDILLIHWNKDSIILAVFNEHKAIFTRYRNLATSLGMTDEQFINEQIIEINRIIDFYQLNITKGTSRITKVLLSGDFSHLQQVKNLLML